MQQKTARQCWQGAFILYGVLSLSSMAGMSIGLGIFGAATLLIFALAALPPEGRLLRAGFRSPYVWASLALFLGALLSLLVAMVFPVEGSQEGPRLASLAKFHYFLYPPFFACALLASEKSLEKHSFWRAWAGMGALLGIIAMVQFFGASLFPEAWLHHDFFRPVGGTARFHGQGLMFFHLSFASCLCFVAATGWARLLWPLASDKKSTLAAWAVVALLSSLGVYFSYSRIAFFALAALLVLLGFLKRPAWGLAATALVSLLGAGIWAVSPSLRDRWVMYGAGNYDRARMWETAWGMFSARPLVGLGFSRTGELSPFFAKRTLGFLPDFTSHAHNNFLDMLASTGLIGTAAFVGWWLFLFLAALHVFRRSPKEERWLPAAALAGFVAFQVNGLTQVNFWDGKSEHTLMIWAGVALALWLRARQRRATN